MPALIGLSILLCAALSHYLILRHRGHPRPHLGVAKWAPLHLGLGTLGWFIAGLFVVATVLHGLGAVRPTARIAAPRPVAGLPASASVEWAMPPVQDQGDTSACVAFAVDEALWAERKMRGEALPYAMPSPWYTYWYNTHGQNVGTSIDGEADSAFNNGMIPLSWLPAFGPAPSQWDIDNAAGYGGTYRYLFSGTAGWSGLQAIEAQIASGAPVVLLLQVNSSFYNASSGQTITDDTGSAVGGHGIVAVAYDSAGDIKIRNSWGNWADGGDIWLTPSAVENYVYAAAVVEPGAVTWPGVQPTATPTPLPRPHPRHHHKPHPRPIYYRVTHTTVLRADPKNFPRTRIMLWRGQRVRYNGKTTTHWIAVCSTKCGFAWRGNVKKL